MKIEIAGSSGREACEDAASLLPPSGGCTHAGATPPVAFRTVVGLDGEVETRATL